MSAMKQEEAIQQVIRAMMERVLDRVLVTDPFIAEKHHARRPLYAALVPDEIFKSAHFERRFVTPFGHAWEQVARVAAQASSRSANVNHMIRGTVGEERLARIQEILIGLEHASREKGKRRSPSWDEEVAYVLEGAGPPTPVAVVCDLIVEDRKGCQAFELKAPLPNSDQTKVSKEKILKLYAMEPRLVEGAFFALPYNPYGRREDYGWPFPGRWFNMREDEVVLIGEEFWDAVGGPGTYQAFINAVNRLGPEYKKRIYAEFLGVEAPPDALLPRL